MNRRDRIVSSNDVHEMLLELKDELERNLYIEAIVKKYRGQIWCQRGRSA